MSRRWFSWLVVLCVLLLSWSVALGTPTAPELIRDSLLASHLWDFSGTQVIVNWTPSGSPSSTTVNVTHRKQGTTLIRYVGGNGRVVLEDGSLIRQYEPSRRALLVDDCPPTPNPQDIFRLLSRSHKMVLAGTDRICGRKTYVVLVIPRVPGNPWRKCWVDYYTKYALKNEEYGPDWPGGKPESFMFWSSISFKPVSAKSVKLDVPNGTRVVTCPRAQPLLSLEQAQKLAGFRIVLPPNPPLGYVYDGANLVQMGGTRVIHLRFTNGLNAVSVFQAGSPISPNSMVHGNSSVVTWRQGSIHIALVGNIDQQELESIRRQMGHPESRMISEVSKRTGATQDLVVRLRDRGFGFRDIGIAVLASRQSGQDPSALLKLYSIGFSWEEIAQRSNFHLHDIRLKLKTLSD